MLVTVETPIERTPRVRQVEGLFDLSTPATSRQTWNVHLPLADRPWHIGLIVGPSGSGKSTLIRHLFADALRRQEALPPWSSHRSILDDFPEAMSIKDVVQLLSAVGFASPPAWLRPYRVLSNGERFRCDLARLLAAVPELAVVDEFTSVVDRTVAQIGSAALAKTVRNRGQRFVAVTCHEDIEAWLQPDWIYRPAEATFHWRCLQRRPAITLDIFRCQAAAWRLFHRHHYLSGDLSPFAVCFLAAWCDRPVAFSAWLHQMTRNGGRREHRTVTLPDYQGVGIGMALSDFCASLWSGLGERATSTTTHPAFTAARQRSPRWHMNRPPSLARARGERRRPGLRHAATRLSAGFVYIGPALERSLALRLLRGGQA
jgi:ABC-type nitrate/sulfonate/bicarbonate transport system ATPase subunit